jgi:hypothetical protein
MLIVLLANAHKWISNGLRKRHEKHYIADTVNNLSHDELHYLLQYIRNKTLLMEFDETNPVVGLLAAKCLISPSMVRIRTGHVYSFKVRHHPQEYEISPFVYRYLVEHPEISRGLTPKPKEHKPR